MTMQLKEYCLKIHAAAMACEQYGCGAAFQLGFVEKWRYEKMVELAKDRKKVIFPASIGTLPVAIFAVGVTWRLVTGIFCALALRLAMVMARKSGGRIPVAPLPKIQPAREKEFDTR